MSAIMHMHKTGLRLDLSDLKSKDIHLEDIAHTLSRIPRFNGNTCRPVSVAEHSLLVYQIVEHYGGDPVTCLQALMHDATEAYIGDIPSYVKACIPEIREFENKLWATIAARFDLPVGMHPAVKEADMVALFIEAGSLCTSANIKEWEGFEAYGPIAWAWIEENEALDEQSMPHPEMMERIFKDIHGLLSEARRETA